MIGIFDSGHGGLTVLRALTERMSGRRFLYLGDHGHAPYGERGAEEIYALTQASVERLFDSGCRLVLLACNTAAAITLRRLQQDWLPQTDPDRRVLGVFVPMVEAVTMVPWQVQGPAPCGRKEPATVAVFATQRTVESGAYAREIALRAPAIRVVEQACPGLVALIETGASPHRLAAAVEGHVAALMARLEDGPPDHVILGCTHYPLVAAAFRAALPSGVPVYSQPALVAESLRSYLDRHPEFDLAPEAAPQVRCAGSNRALGQGDDTPIEQRLRFLTTGDPDRVGQIAGRFFGARLRFEKI